MELFCNERNRYIKNTIEAFKNEDKAAFIKHEAAKIWDRIPSGS